MKNDSTFHRSPIQALKYYYITNCIGLFILLVILSLLLYFSYLNHWWPFTSYIFLGLGLLSILNTCISPLIKYRYRYYKIHEDFVILKRLFIFKKEELSKIERIQFIDIGTNPLSKKLNLNSVTLFTAGHTISFPIISEKEAQNIQQQILLRLRGANDDV